MSCVVRFYVAKSLKSNHYRVVFHLAPRRRFRLRRRLFSTVRVCVCYHQAIQAVVELYPAVPSAAGVSQIIATRPPDF